MLNLQWDIIRFNMLVLSFSDLTKCTEINFSEQITEIYKIINSWNKRSPIGKITIVKKFLVVYIKPFALITPKLSLLIAYLQIYMVKQTR